MHRADPVTTARELVHDRFPHALQAWLSGSVVLGGATPTSDLDITVLVDGAQVRRESLVYCGWPVELFVHTEDSARHFVAEDLARRRPTMARLIATGVPLLAADAGASLRKECAEVVTAGPGPLPERDLILARYTLTNHLDDLTGGASAGVMDAIVIAVWESTAHLLLATAPWWSGSGKWLIRELQALDTSRGTSFGARLHGGLHAALAGDPAALIELADHALDQVGGRVWDGFRSEASSRNKGS